MMDHGDHGDDDEDDDLGKGKGPPWREFNCPECTAENDYSDGFGPGDELVCMYCGMPWEVRETESSFKLRAP